MFHIHKCMSEKNYLKLIGIHLAIGALVVFIPYFAKFYAFLIVITALYFIIKNKNRNNEVMYAAAYILGSEVFLRTTYGNPMHEYGKYFVVLFILIGLFYEPVPKKNNPYWVYLLLLVPSIILGIETLQFNTRTTILFNISGPICLGICSLYTYKRKISLDEINGILLFIGLPILSFVTYLFIICPINNFVIGSTESNYSLSGGYAPNQTATILGLGIFVFAIRLFLVSTSKVVALVNILLLAYIYYRTLLTFSRGGTLTALIIIFVLFFALLINKKYNSTKIKIGGFLALLISVFWLTSYQTDGLLWMRYTDKNPNGLTKSAEKNGRKYIAMNEIRLFEENPLLGVGVGEGKEIRKSEMGKEMNTHSEITRLLAEHGVLGLLSLVILVLTPLILLLRSKQNIYQNKQNVYLLCFFMFWLLTINHSAMRIAAPSFVYALVLLNIRKEDEVSLA